jgi:hypothetical protein
MTLAQAPKTNHVATSNWIFVEGSKILENLCDHPVSLRDDEGNQITLRESPRPARCNVEKRPVALLNIDNRVMLPVMESHVTEVTNVPPFDARRMYIVPLPVAKKLHTRTDLLCMDQLMRSARNNEVVCAMAVQRPI